jgi:tetratricopeptide (TPR) repeat protein
MYWAFAVIIALGLGLYVYFVHVISSKITLSQLREENSYRFVRLALLCATFVVSFSMLNVTVDALVPKLFLDESTYHARQKNEVVQVSYEVYVTSAQAIMALLEHVKDELPNGLYQSVKNDLASGGYENVHRLGIWIRSSQLPSYERSNALSWMGIYLESQGRLDTASSLYEDALIADPNNGRAAYNLSMLLAALGKSQLEHAKSVSAAVIDRIGPDNASKSEDLAWAKAGLAGIITQIGDVAQGGSLFEESIRLIDKAMVDGQAGPLEAAQIRNDAAAVALRRRDLPEAKRLLCRSLELRGASERTAEISSAETLLNLGSVLREQGRIGDSMGVVNSVVSNFERRSSGERNDLFNVAKLLRGQLHIYTRNYENAQHDLDDAQSYFEKVNERFGAFGFRLGRVFQMRQLISFQNMSFPGADQFAGKSLDYFKASEGDAAYDNLEVLFVSAAGKIIVRDLQAASKIDEQMKRLIDKLRLTDNVWAMREAALSNIVSVGEDVSTWDTIIAGLIDMEKMHGSYDVETDVLIFSAHGGQGSTPYWDVVTSYRTAAGARGLSFNEARNICND